MSKNPAQVNRCINSLRFLMLLWLALFWVGQGAGMGASVPITQFNNPILENLADPMIFREVNGTSGAVTYYMAGTSFARYRSKDMVHWERLSNWSNINQANISGVWACELIKKGSTYYLYFSAIKPSGDKRVIYVATSANIEGTFTIQTTPVVELPNNNTIDPHPFRDPVSGKFYLYYSQDQASDPENIARIYVMELSANMLGMLAGTSASLCVEAETQSWESRWQEGASVQERNGTYYLFYSSRCYCSDSYAVGYATASSPMGGTWAKYAGNPILQKKNTEMGKVSGPGHINLVKAPDGVEDWMVYHAHIAIAGGGQRHAAMDRYRFQPATNGGPDIVVVDGPTLAKQPFPAGAPIAALVGPMETFDNGSLNRNRWRKVRQENGADYQLTGSQLMIKPRSGSLFTDGVDNPVGNVIMQHAPGSWDWVAETSLAFAGVPISRQGDIFGGIVAWQDARHYVAARIDAGKRLSIETCNQTQGSAEVITNIVLSSTITNANQLRLFYEGGKKKFTFLASSNGTAFTEVATVPSPLSNQRFIYVGPMAHSRAGTSEVSAAEVRFNWFQLSEETYQEYRWPLDADATDVLGGLTGSLENTPAFVTDRVQGSGSLFLDGNSSILLNTNTVLEEETFACTLSFWFKPARLQGLQVLYEEGGAQNGFGVRLNGSTLEACVASNFVMTSVYLTGIVSNVWHFATVMFEGRNGNPGVLAMFCDGRSTFNTNAPGSIPTHINASGFGAINSNYAFGDGGGRFMGWIDDIRLTKGDALAPNLLDGDGDGLTDAQEIALGTNPSLRDTDADGVSDGLEVLRLGTNPNSAVDNLKIRVVSNPAGFVIPSTSVFHFVFEQWNPSNGQWAVKAGPFTTAGVPRMVPLDQLGFSTNETSVILRIRMDE